MTARRAQVVAASLVALAALASAGCGHHDDAPAPDAAAQTATPPAAQPPAEAAPATPQPAPAPQTQAQAPAPKHEKHETTAAPTAAPAAVAEASKPAPPPEPIVKTLPAGTGLNIQLVSAASSKTSQIGDAIRAKLTQAIELDGMTVVPAGATISGTITEAHALSKIGGQALLGVKFDTLELAEGHSVPIVASIEQKGKSETGKDAGTIAGATAGGALLGRLLSKHDKTKGTLIGAAVGAAAGTGAAAATKGQEVEWPAGSTLALKLEENATVTVQR
ncbi:MAG TPA: glycine zipper 2TM domain-containing protein [Candidatus Polarisedimenticolaceae bacterium]|nr:glycine zipper 2TM domain-containing protein [Candidatus Polarisedimenticolaceae bacterium]